MTNNSAAPKSGHVAIVGGSMTGLAVARILSDHFDRVTLIERDTPPDAAVLRKGVPQAPHIHVLLKKGEEILAGLFPTLMESLQAAGAVIININHDAAYHHFGGWKAHPTKLQPLTAISLTRPLLEVEVRRCVYKLPGVKVLEATSVTGLATTPDRGRITGVRLQRAGAGEETLEADLVVDCSGRGTRLPAWLEEIGRSRVRESTIKVDLGYGTRYFKRSPPNGRPWKMMVLIGEGPASKRMGFLAPVEGDRWVCTLAGVLGDYPPVDDEGWFEYARSLPAPDIYDTLEKEEPIGEPVAHRFPSDLRRRYDWMPDFPGGLVVLGDAHCSINPIYAQGMAACMLSADLLGRHVAEARQAGALLDEHFSRRYQRALGRLADEPWALSTGEDLRYPETQGDRPFGLSAIHWYAKRFHQVSQSDPELAHLFFSIANMLTPIGEMMRPRIVWKVLKGPLERRP